MHRGRLHINRQHPSVMKAKVDKGHTSCTVCASKICRGQFTADCNPRESRHVKVMIERSIIDGGVVPCMWHGVVIIRPSARLGSRLKSR